MINYTVESVSDLSDVFLIYLFVTMVFDCVCCADLCSVYSSARCSTSRSVLPSGEEQGDLGLHLRSDNRVSIQDVIYA